MKQYDSYKDSGVEWIGKVPSHWEILRGKYMLDILSGFPFDSKKFEYDDNYMPLIRIRDINSSSTEVYYSGVYPKESVVKKGEVLIGMDGDFNVSRWNGPEALLNQRVCKLSESSKMNTCFAFYMLSLPLKLTNDVTYATTVKHLSVYDIYNTFLPVPTIAEQEGIANYLDKKCSEIDNVISAQQKRIALLQELKQSVITHAVTKGLNPNVEMKDSGVEWIGKIPASWDVVHLKRILRERMQYGANEPAESDDTTYPRYIRITDITANGELRPETFKSLEPSKAKDYLLDKGDVLFARSGATVGKTFLFNADIKACYAGYLIKASCDKRRMLPEYLYYYTQSGAYECWKNSVFIQSTIQNIGADKYQMMYIPVPSKDEQKQIVEYTMRKSQIFDAAISKAQHQVELLQEYKQSLITEVVTGKRKVS